jgi:hypothetical protein
MLAQGIDLDLHQMFDLVPDGEGWVRHHNHLQPKFYPNRDRWCFPQTVASRFLSTIQSNGFETIKIESAGRTGTIPTHIIPLVWPIALRVRV